MPLATPNPDTAPATCGLALPTVSLVIPVRNGLPHLAAAIQSALAQTRPPAEILVIDDHSTDGSAAAAAQFGRPVRVLENPGSGAAAARNHGAAAAAGPLLAFLDADDLWTPGKLALQCARLESDARLEAVFGMCRPFLCPSLSPEEAARIKSPAGAVPGIHASAMLIRKEAFERIGPFDPSRAVGDFVEWFLRAARAGLRYDLPDEVVFERRLHAANQGRGRAHAYAREFVGILRAHLAARGRP